jgi:hypothetical protein
VQRKLFALIEAAGTEGIRARDLFERAYDDDPDGGPLTGTSVIAIMVRHINRRVQPVGLVIRRHGGMYRLFPVRK